MSTSAVQLDPAEMRNLAISLGQNAPPAAIAAPVSLPSPQQPPDLGISTPQPHIVAPRGTIAGDTAERSRMLQTGAGEDQIYSKVTGSQFGQQHPVISKILGGLGEGIAKAGDIGLSAVAPALAINLPGTEYHHQMQLHQLNRQIGDETAEGEKQAQTANIQSEIPVHDEQRLAEEQAVAAKTPIEITPEQAQTMGSPELAGVKVPSAVFAALSKQHSINATREDVTGENVEGREKVAETAATSRENAAQTGAQSRESVAQINADARQRATDAQDMTRQAVARIRGASEPKGAGSVTNNSKARGEMSETMLQQAPAILQEIDALNDKIGPGAGRWNNFWVKKGGLNDPDYAALDQDLGLYASALAVAHFGARGGGAHFIDQMKKDFSQAQSPEDLKARILHADKWLEGYAAEGKGQGPSASPNGEVLPPSSGKAVSLKDAMALSQNKGKSEADVRKDIEAHGHKVVE